MSPPEARINERTPTYEVLQGLPQPVDQTVVAVYKFRDQTGQYRPSENGSSFSTAVTQGATAILIKALDDSGYFKSIERENVSNLLNERKIIRSTRTQYGNPQANESQVLPPLLYAGIIIEGGIVSYDANVLTGGAGARYFGAGANTRYRQDRVTVYLRAISTLNGQVLKTVNTSRTILSQALDGGIFRFVRFQRLLEAEMGYTYNEPGEIAVRSAIEKAVQVLVLEGLVDGLWGTRDTTGQAITQIQALREEQMDAAELDLRGQYGEAPRPRYFVGALGGVARYNGDFGPGRFTGAFGADVGIRFTPTVGISGSAAGTTLASLGSRFERPVGLASLSLDYRPVPDYRLVPVLRAGLGATVGLDNNLELTEQVRIVPHLSYSGGLEFKLSEHWELHGQVGNYYTLTDLVDGERHGKFNDWYLHGQVGIHLLFGRPTGQPR